MKKSFFGYNVSEVDVVIGALREENESLNNTITTLKTQIKNSTASNGAKTNLIEADLKKNEELLKKVSEEKNELLIHITSLKMEADVLNQQNAELTAQVEKLHRQNEDLNCQLTKMQTQMTESNHLYDSTNTDHKDVLLPKAASGKEHNLSLEQELHDKKEDLAAAACDREETYSRLEAIPNSQQHIKAQMLISTDEYECVKEELQRTKAALESVTGEMENVTDDYHSMKKMLVSTCASLDEKVNELDRTHKEIEQLKNELAIAKIAADELAKMNATEKKQLVNINQASEISFKAYYDMSKMRNEVVEYMHEQMKEYYQFVNDNSIRMRTAIEQRQFEYNQMIREFYAKASEFRASLSNVDGEYNNLAEYSMNFDKISNRLKEIMDHFIEEATTNLKKKEEALKPGEEITNSEASFGNHTEEIKKKPIVFKIS